MKKVKVLFPLAALVLAIGGVLVTSASKSAKFVNTPVKYKPTTSSCEEILYCAPGGSCLCTYTVATIKYFVFTAITSNCNVYVVGSYTNVP